jgi:O-antigen/teichoic acid export membrane protein
MNVVTRYTSAGVWQQVRPRLQRLDLMSIVGNASSLSATAIVTSGLGFVFWTVAARSASPAAVGLAAAAVSASSLIASMSMLGLGTFLIGEIAAARPGAASLVSTGFFVVGLCGCLLGTTFVALGPVVVPEFRPLSGAVAFGVIFAAAAGIQAVASLLDQLMVGLLRGELQLARNTIFALGKLIALVVAAPLLVRDNGLVIFGVWPLGTLVSIAALGGFLLLRPVAGPGLSRPRFELLGRIGRTALLHHTLNLALQAPTLVLPVLVTALLSSTANAYFYTASMIATVAFLPQTALAVTLYALGARNPGALGARARVTLVLGLAEGAVAIAIIQLIGDRLLAAFGGNYASEAGFTLRILILAIVPMVIKTHFVAFARVRRRVHVGAIAVVLGACLELAAAAIGGRLGGLAGLSVGWVLAMGIEGICMLPPVWRMALGPARE